MRDAHEVKGGAIVHKRTPLYEFGVGVAAASYTFAEATYTGDVDGPALETFVALKHQGGDESHYGFGSFTGTVVGRSGTMNWKFKGQPGRGEIEILNGVGELDGIRGRLSYVVVEGSSSEFTYHGTIEWDSKE